MNYYFQKIKDNIWNPAYYEEILIKPFGSSFKYYLKMSLWLTLVITALVSVLFLPNFISLVRQTVTSVAKIYPAELKIHFNNGQASINMPEPVIIPLSSLDSIFKGKIEKNADYPRNLLVIDTRTDFVLSEFNNYKSLLVLKRDSFVAMGNKDEVRISEIPKDNIIISGEDVKNFANKIQSVILVVAPLGVLVIYFFGLFFFLFSLGYLIFIALLAWLFLYVVKRDITFKQSLAVTLHACTLPFLVSIFMCVFNPFLTINFPFLATLTLLIIYFNLINKQKTIASIPVEPEIKPIEEVKTDRENGDTSN